MVAKFENPTE